jgi:hypothetical protein
MVSTIVVALDGSEASERTLPVIRELAPPERMRLKIIHVRERLVGRGAGPLHVNDDELIERVKARAAELGQSGYETRLHIEKTMGCSPPTSSPGSPSSATPISSSPARAATGLSRACCWAR